LNVSAAIESALSIRGLHRYESAHQFMSVQTQSSLDEVIVARGLMDSRLNLTQRRHASLNSNALSPPSRRLRHRSVTRIHTASLILLLVLLLLPW